MSKLIAAAKQKPEVESLIYLAGTAATATFGASAIVLAAMVFVVP